MSRRAWSGRLNVSHSGMPTIAAKISAAITSVISPWTLTRKSCSTGTVLKAPMSTASTAPTTPWAKTPTTAQTNSLVQSLLNGQSLINPSMAGKLLTEFATLARRDSEEERVQQVPAPKLTDREMQVLKLVARGMNNRDIAKELFISENTVKNHVRNILEKLQIHSRMEAVMVAVREKLIEFS